MSGKILQVFNFLDIHSNDFLKMLLIAGVGGGVGWLVGGGNKFIKNMLLLFPKKKIYSGGNGQFWDELGAKMMYFFNSGSTLRIFLKFCKIKEAKRYKKIDLLVFSKKYNLG